MKILMVSNLYPPYYHGGYEVRCLQVAEALQRSGYEVCVLTSAYGLPLSTWANIQPYSEEMNGVPVHRWLHQYAYGRQPSFHRPWNIFQAKRELWDTRQFLKLLKRFQPDIVNWWSMNGLAKTLLPLPQQWGIPDVHWIEHPWMIQEYGIAGEKEAGFWINFWEGNWGPPLCRPVFRWIGRWWEKRIELEGLPTRNFPNRPTHICFVSEYLRTMYREAGLEFPSSEIIYGGVPIAPFYEPIRPQDPLAPLRFLYAGQITPDRGLHTIIEALGYVEASLRSQFTLSIAGYYSANYANYFQQTQNRIKELGLTTCVSFLGKVLHSQMPQVYKQHDVLVFASTRPEGFPLTMVEAMLAGCAVVTTGSGGAMEIATLADLPLFPKDNPEALSRLLSHLITHRSEVMQIASHGQKVALQEFTFDRMMERWTKTLHQLYKVKNTMYASIETP